MPSDKGIVFSHELILLASVIVCNANLPVVPKNPLKLLLCKLMIEPVKRLSHNDQVDAGIFECRVLSSSFYADKVWKAAKVLLSKGPHFIIGFDTEDLVPVLQE